MSIVSSPRLRERSEGLKLINQVLESKENSLIIHYSCESFITSHGKTPRVTSISIKRVKSGQVHSFSIHLQAQFKGLDFNNLSDENYDELEKRMLSDFFKFVKKHSTNKWLHWNMRDSNFGFEAISNRFKILGGTPNKIEDHLKYDLPSILGKIYTFNYEENKPNGRLLNLATRNDIGQQNALKGKDEAVSFENKEYLKLHISTLKKVDIMNSILRKIEVNELKVNSKLKDIFGFSVPGIFVIIKETPWLLFVFTIIGIILGAAFEPLIQNLFGT